MSKAIDDYNAALRAKRDETKTQSTVSEPTIAPINTIQRDLAREGQQMKKWGADASTLAGVNPKTLYEATYSANELAQLPEYQQIVQMEQAGRNLDATTPPTNMMMGVLEEALRAKEDVGKQALGGSELYAQAGIPTEGVSAYSTLNQNIQQRAQEMGNKYQNFSELMTDVAGDMKDAYNIVADKYDRLRTEYNAEADRMSQVTQQIMQQEHAMDLLMKQKELDKEVDDEFVVGDLDQVGDPKSPYFKECGHFSNNLTNADFLGKHVGNSWDSKISTADRVYRQSDGVSIDPENFEIKPGNTLLIPMGEWGHTAVATHYNKATGDIFVVERNKKLDGATTEGVYNLKDLKSNYPEFGVANTSFKSKYADTMNPSAGGSNTGLTGGNKDIAVARIGKLVYGTRISDKESERIERIIESVSKENPDATTIDVAKRLLGWAPTKHQELGDSLLNILYQYTDDDSLAGFDVMSLSRLLDNDNPGGAVNKVEKLILSMAKDEEDDYIGEGSVRAANMRVDEVADLVKQLIATESNPIGNGQGTVEEWLGRFKSNEAQELQSQAFTLIKEFANKFMGANMTEHELKFYDPMMPRLSDTLENFESKLSRLQTDPLLQLNAMRTTYSLPAINKEQLLDVNKRAPLYIEDVSIPMMSDLSELEDIKAQYNINYE